MFSQVQYTQTFYSQGKFMLGSKASNSVKIFPLQNFFPNKLFPNKFECELMR